MNIKKNTKWIIGGVVALVLCCTLIFTAINIHGNRTEKSSSNVQNSHLTVKSNAAKTGVVQAK